MQLIDNASKAPRMWSVRLAALTAAFGGIEVMVAVINAFELSLPLWEGVMPQGVFAALSTLTALASGVARVIKQRNL